MREADKRAAKTEGALNDMARQVDRSMRQNNAKKTGELIGIVQGMKDLAKKLGIHCSCATFQPGSTGSKGAPMTSCRCGSTAAKLRTKEQLFKSRKPLVLFQFSGAHCRDGAGKFVPIPRCTGKKPKRKTP